MVVQPEKQNTPIMFRVSKRFKADMELVARKANAPSLSEFIKQAVIREGERLGVKVRR